VNQALIRKGPVRPSGENHLDGFGRGYSTPDAMECFSRLVSRNPEELGIKRPEEHSPEEPVAECAEGKQESVVKTRWGELWL
jgi:hypothetical protein